MPPHPQAFHIRDASSTTDDINFIVSAWDSTLPFLHSIGAGEMWGDQPFSQREGFQDDIADIIRNSEADPTRYTRRLMIAETDADEDGTIVRKPVGSMMVRDALPEYLIHNFPVAEALLFIEVLFVDHRCPLLSKGAGAALVEELEVRARAIGKKAVYVDAWAGNDGRLNRYYTRLQYHAIGDFALTRKDGSRWVGTLFRKALDASGA